ncbi:MarR family transcriptional regulator [Rhodoferax sp.]|uniref:MarR family winged helix-turn-helix transcriptional regulator n=1 Tax=Rhodoferax sp. TaxID=50421 RepID=UPI0025F092AA|nr:MarR family transcriptional regulator [Rhodoferax sp.]
MTTPLPTPALPGLDDFPGHTIRRLQQIAVGIFLDETGDLGITPVQFALLFAAAQQTGLDQRTLAGKIGLDTSTIGAVVDRLEGRELIARQVSPDDKRVRLLSVTPAGRDLLDTAMPAMQRAQERMLAPLPPADRPVFMAMVQRIVEQNGAWSRGAKEAS